MSNASKPNAIFQLLAIALHSFIFSAFVLAALPPIADRLRIAEPLRESQLAVLNKVTDSATLSRGVKRSDSQSTTAVLAFAVFHPTQAKQHSRLRVGDSERWAVSGSLPIRSPPSAPSR